MKNEEIYTYDTHPLTWRIRKDKKTVFLKEYKTKNGYLGLKKALIISPIKIIEIIKNSKLKGRGGAGFSTGIKWSLMYENNTDYDRYLICNADEMEPGTYKDRFILENLPHLLIEGMVIAAFALNTNIGYIFLRKEYIEIKKILKIALNEAQENLLLGYNILNSGFNFKLFLHTGAGRYICGEETALINSLEGKRANPRSKPPYPSFSGLWGRPTCINNVETLCNLPAILDKGYEWYTSISKFSLDTGTKLMGFSGKVNNPGIWEFPFGISAKEILEKYAKGIKNNLKLKAWLPGGTSTEFLNNRNLDIPMDFIGVKQAGSRLGTAIAIAFDNTINIVSILYNIEKFFSRESCGLCTPCREGLPWSLKILKKLKLGKGKFNDIKILEDICNFLGPNKTFCAFAPGAASPIKSAIRLFRTDFEKCIK